MIVKTKNTQNIMPDPLEYAHVDDVDVDDVDDDEAGAGAHFFALRRQWMGHSQSRGQNLSTEC